MLWICLRLPQLAIELRPSLESGPAAVTDGAGNRRHLIACNEAARDRGLCVGMDVPSCLLREPELRLFARAKADERRALHAVACWGHQFTSEVCVDAPRWIVWLEAGSSLRYFDGLSSLYTRIRDGIVHLGYTACLGVAPTQEGAALLALHRQVPPALNRIELRRCLQPLPLTGLDIAPDIAGQLQAAGLRTLADLLEIPAAALARRFGPGLPRHLQCLLGERSEPRRRHRIPPAYRRRFDFPEPVAALEGLLFPLRRLLQEFEGYLRGRDAAIQQVTVTLCHRDPAATVLELVTSSPQRDGLRLFALLREKLERTVLPSAVTGIVLAATHFVPPAIMQGDFFDDRQRRNESWSALLDRLRARLGEDAVRQLGLREDHRPEHAWCIVKDIEQSGPAAEFPDRPLWLLAPRPVHSLPHLLGTPERIESGWWDGQDISRDYYLARTAEGARWWLFRDTGTGRWYLQGLWA